jgi:hypothetical protein
VKISALKLLPVKSYRPGQSTAHRRFSLLCVPYIQHAHQAGGLYIIYIENNDINRYLSISMWYFYFSFSTATAVTKIQLQNNFQRNFDIIIAQKLRKNSCDWAAVLVIYIRKVYIGYSEPKRRWAVFCPLKVEGLYKNRHSLIGTKFW